MIQYTAGELAALNRYDVTPTRAVWKKNSFILYLRHKSFVLDVKLAELFNNSFE